VPIKTEENTMNKIFRLSAIALGALATACTGVTSVQLGSDADSKLGVAYYLPTSLIPMEVQVNTKTGEITVKAAEPVYVADQELGPLRLNSMYSPFHSETVQLKTTESGLLDEIKFDSDARVDEALVNFVKSAGSIPGGGFAPLGVDQVSVLQANVDIAALANVSPAPNARTAGSTDTGNPEPAAIASLNSRINNALDVALGITADDGFSTRNAAGPQKVSLAVQMIGPRNKPATVSKADLDKCKVGFCYRRAVPYMITATFFGKYVQQRIVHVPNGAPVYAARLDRGLFTKWTNDAKLTNGMLKEYKYTTDASEVEKLALLPFDLIGAAADGLLGQGKFWDAASTRLKSELEYQKVVEEARISKSQTKDAGTDNLLFVMGARDPEDKPQSSE